MARLMLRVPILVVGVCALAVMTAATLHANTRLLTYGTQLQQAQQALQRAQLAQQQAQQQVQLAQQQAYAQPQAYYGAVPIPLQRYMYINGQPYAVLDQNIQYVEPQAQAASPPPAQVYAAPAAPVAPVAPEAPVVPETPVAPVSPAAPTDSAETYAAAPNGGATAGQEQPPPDTAPAANDGKSIDTETVDIETVVPKGTGTAAEGDTSAAPDAPQGPAAPSAPAAPAAPAAPTSYGASAAGPALVATPTVYLSSSSTPGLTAEGPITMTVGNPKVTVHRTVTQYTSQEPPRAVPRDVVITFTRNGQAAPIRVPIINSYSAPFRAELKPEPTLVKTTSTWTVPDPAGDKPDPSAGAAPGQAATVYSQPGSTSVVGVLPTRPTVSITTYQAGGTGAAAAIPAPAAQPPPSVSITTYSQPQPQQSVGAGTLVPGLPPAANRPSVTITSYAQPGTAYTPQVAAPGGPPGLRKVFEDPVTHRAYYSDAAGRIYDSTGSPLIMEPAAPAPPAPAAPAASVDVLSRPTYWGGLRELGPLSTVPAASGSGLDSGSGTAGTAPSGNVREDYKQDGMTALLRMYAPTTYEPVPPPSNYDQPLRLTISTGKSAEAGGQDAAAQQGPAGPASPLSPGDSGPSRGDSW